MAAVVVVVPVRCWARRTTHVTRYFVTLSNTRTGRAEDMSEEYVALSDEDSEEDIHGYPHAHRQPPELQVGGTVCLCMWQVCVAGVCLPGG